MSRIIIECARWESSAIAIFNILLVGYIDSFAVLVAFHVNRSFRAIHKNLMRGLVCTDSKGGLSSTKAEVVHFEALLGAIQRILKIARVSDGESNHCGLVIFAAASSVTR